MCGDRQKRERKFEWIRDRNGDPKKMQNGSYVMQNDDGACYVFDVETIDRVKALLNEIREFENG